MEQTDAHFHHGRSLRGRLKAAFFRRRWHRMSNKAWKARHDKVFHLHPEYRGPAPKNIEEQHLSLWRQLADDVNLDTLRVCANISGKSSPEIVPEEVFETEILACLNAYPYASFLDNKNFYDKWFPQGVFPRVFIHNIDGDFFDGDYRFLARPQVDEILPSLPYPLVLKASMGPHGGRGVSFPASSEELRKSMAGMKNYVIQQRINQHPFFQRYNTVGVNTLRVCTYKSVLTNEIHILHIAMRMGKGGSLDNETSGGIVTFINEDGSVNDYAVDKYGGKFTSHPDTGIQFTRKDIVPKYAELREFGLKMARQLFLARIASLDACLDESGQWRLIEIGLGVPTIRFSQYAGVPFFGKFTGEVIAFCKEHRWWGPNPAGRNIIGGPAVIALK